jgi:nicotinate-nucleotide adenylyltransferase
LKRHGVMGGSFDPVHLGHLWIATFAAEQLDLDVVHLVPAAVPPHKERPVAPYGLRSELVRLAISGFPKLTWSDLEKDESRPSYTVGTLQRLRAILPPEDEIWLLIGEDSLRDFPTWKEPEEIVRLCSLGIYGRPGYVGEVPAGARARWIDGPACGLSSSWIRRRLRAGLTVAPLVPPGVAPRIEGPGPYRQD